MVSRSGSMSVLEVPEVVISASYQVLYRDLMDHLKALGHSTAHIELKQFKQLIGIDVANPYKSQDAVVNAEATTGHDKDDIRPSGDERPDPILFCKEGIVVTDVSGNIIQAGDENVTIPRHLLHKVGRLYELWAYGYTRSTNNAGGTMSDLVVAPGDDLLPRSAREMPLETSRPVPAEGDALFLLYAYLLKHLPLGGPLFCSRKATKEALASPHQPDVDMLSGLPELVLRRKAAGLLPRGGRDEDTPEEPASYSGFLEFLKQPRFAAHPKQQQWVNGLDKKKTQSILLARHLPILRDCRWARYAQSVLNVGPFGSAHEDPFSEAGDQSCIHRSTEKQRQMMRDHRKKKSTIREIAKLETLAAKIPQKKAKGEALESDAKAKQAAALALYWEAMSDTPEGQAQATSSSVPNHTDGPGGTKRHAQTDDFEEASHQEKRIRLASKIPVGVVTIPTSDVEPTNQNCAPFDHESASVVPGPLGDPVPDSAALASGKSPNVNESAGGKSDHWKDIPKSFQSWFESDDESDNGSEYVDDGSDHHD